MPSNLRLTDYRLRRDTLTRLRWLAIAGQGLAVIFVAAILRFSLPLWGTGLTIAAAAAVNIALSLRYPPGHRFASHTSALILAVDIVQLAALLYLTGGLHNPFAMLFLAPVLISATALPPRLTVLLGMLTVALASCLALWHLPLPWRAGEIFDMPAFYTAGVWASIVISLAFIGVYAWRVAEEARQMATALSLTELALMREQHLTALDGMAAAAAHKLGTPLGTIAVVAREMDRLVRPDDPMKEDIDLLIQETARCRDILSRIATLGQDEGGPLEDASVAQLLEEIAAPHRNFGIDIIIDCPTAEPQPRTPRNPGLIYALGNLVDNAVDFARHQVRLEAGWTAETVTLSVIDDGPGIAPDVLHRIGDPFVTTRAERLTGDAGKRGVGGGMGLGLFITKTLLERSGARVTWKNTGSCGARVDIHWPRAAFSHAEARVLG